MPNQVNSFIKGKMNKDLDPRIIPVGEYIDATDVLISRSESGDVGAVENIKSTLKVSNNESVESWGVYIIGFCLDAINNCVYYFGTTFYGYGSQTLRPDSNDRCAIIKHEFSNNNTTILFESHRFNFDQHFPITGVNIIDGYLFFTDNKNQPRVFNVNDSSAYVDNWTLEDQLSVCKYSPVCAPELLQPKYILKVNGAVGAKAIVNVAVNNSANVAVDGNLTGTTIAVGMTVTGDGIVGVVTVDTVTSQTAIILSSAQTLADNVILTFSSNVITIDAANSTLETDFGNGIKFKVLDGAVAFLQDVLQYGTTGGDPPWPYGPNPQTIPDDIVVTAISGTTLTVNRPITISDDTELTLLCSSMIDNSGNDPNINTEFLKEKFVRFSYRFRFKDNTYSVMAPFSQVAFVPQITTLDAAAHVSAYKETEIATFVNSINQLELKIDMPAEYPYSHFFIEGIEILLKESDSVAVKVVDKIDVTTSALIALKKDATTITYGKVGTTKLQAYISDIYKRRHELYYVYRSDDAYKTLSENQITRVFDNVPNKALAQELISNRVVYGNYYQGKSIPSNLDFELASGSKTGDDEFVYEEYTRHTLKQDRTYSVGIILADRYGRQSPVLLSKNHSSSLLNKRSTVSTTGDCLKVIFNEKINENLYEGDIDSSSYNPLGWYSYKVVVQQKEQDYYNVYTPGITKYETNSTGDGYSYIPIFGDNVNKIPRDEITEGASNIALKLSSSSVLLDDIVQNGQNTIQSGKHNVIAIGELEDLIPTGTDHACFYNPLKNFLFGQIKGDVGVSSGQAEQVIFSPDLAIFETKPFRSKLDIFYETSTCGLITDLNAKIDEGSGGVAPADLKLKDLDNIEVDKNEWNESVVDGVKILRIRVYDANGTELTISANDLSIEIKSIGCDGRNIDLDSIMSAEVDSGVYKVELQTSQEFLPSPSNIFNVTFQATTNQGTTYFEKTIEIKNILPNLAFTSGIDCLTYTPGTTGKLTKVNDDSTDYPLKIVGKNGSGSIPNEHNNLAGDEFGVSAYSYEKVSGDSRILVDRDGTISIDPESNGIAANETNVLFVLKVTDIGDLASAATIIVDGESTSNFTVPLCVSPDDHIDIGSGTCTGTKYNYYDRCYGSQGSQDPGDKYQEYFIPASLTFCSIDGNCNTSNFEDILSNHITIDTATSGNDVTNWMTNERFTKIKMGGKALVNGATDGSGAIVAVDGHSTGFIIEKDMEVTGSGITGTVTVASVQSQSSITLSQNVTLSTNVILTFGKVILDAADFTGIDYFVRLAPHDNDTPGFSGYVGASGSNFIVTIGSNDYEVIIGVATHSGLYADPDAGGSCRKLVRRSSITVEKYS